MGPAVQTFVRRARMAGAAAAIVASSGVLAGPTRAAEARTGCTPVLGQAANTAEQLAGWFATTGRSAKLDVSILDLATMFVEEGAREGVRGDIAFAQSIVETGYFGFSPSVPPALHNYSGIGATGGGVQGAAFPDARTGVRAQVQHLRAYADPSLRSEADLKAPRVDPRFRFLVPNGRTVPCWEQFGGGVWAADPTGYGPRVLAIHQRIGAFPRPIAAPEAVAPVPVPLAPAEVPAVAVDPLPMAEAVTGDLLADPVPSLDTSLFATQGMVLAGQPAMASTTGGLAALASALTGAALLTICATLWWHGRRFASH